MPWFKNSVIYHFTKPTHFAKQELENALSALLFRPCMGQELSHLGWVCPCDDDTESYSVIQHDQVLLKAKKETKLLPTPVIKQAWHARILQRERDAARPLNKTEKSALKEDVITELLPRAFSKYQTYWVWIDLTHQRVIVDATSLTQAEQLISLLRKCVGSLPLAPLSHAVAPEILFTEWVKTQRVFPTFQLGDEAEFKDPLDGQGILRCKQHDLLCDEIRQHLTAGKQITKLKIVQENTVHFILQNDLTLKRIKFDNSVQDRNETIDKNDKKARVCADFLIMSKVLSVLFNELNEVFNSLSVK